MPSGDELTRDVFLFVCFFRAGVKVVLVDDYGVGQAGHMNMETVPLSTPVVIIAVVVTSSQTRKTVAHDSRTMSACGVCLRSRFRFV